MKLLIEAIKSKRKIRGKLGHVVQVWRKRESNLSIDWCITRAPAKLRVQDFETGKNFSFNQAYTRGLDAPVVQEVRR